MNDARPKIKRAKNAGAQKYPVKQLPQVFSDIKPTQPNPKPIEEVIDPLGWRKFTRLFIILGVIVILSGGGLWYGLNTHQGVSILPMSIVNEVSFKVYFPPKETAGYGYSLGTAKYNNGLLSYKLNNRTNIITVIEQVAPPKAIDLTVLPGYSKLELAIGQAVIGQSIGNPSVIILTDSTLINMTSSKNVTPSDIARVAHDMEAVQ
jgi:hypothetical protein